MFGKFCLRTLVGVVVFCVFGGKDAVGMLAMVVICTFGAGLLVVLPAAYLIGLLCTIWFIPFGRKPPEDEETRSQSVKPSKDVALAEYIEHAERRGRSWPSIREDLLKQGWDPNTLADVRASVHAMRNQREP